MWDDGEILANLAAAAGMPECPVLAQLGFSVPELRVEFGSDGPSRDEGDVAISERQISNVYYEWRDLKVPRRFLLVLDTR
jgi:hypothetical protein